MPITYGGFVKIILMAKIKDLPSFKRPRERLADQGPHALKDYELLAILLRTGYQGKSVLEVAKRILKRYSLEKLANLSFQDLAKIKGVGQSRAATIIAAFKDLYIEFSYKHKQSYLIRLRRQDYRHNLMLEKTSLPFERSY